MKQKLAAFILYVYLNYIGNLNDCDLTNLGKIVLTPAWYIRGLFIYILSFIFFPVVLIHRQFKDLIDGILQQNL